MGKSGVWVLLALPTAACAAPFPTPEARQLRLRDSGDVAAMRRHG